MSQWSSRAIGLWHDSKDPLSATSLQGMDFLLAKIGANFVQGHCNLAYNAKIPFGLFFEADPELYGLCPIGDFNRWPDITGDPTIKMLDSYIMSGTMKRAIHFIVIDCSKTINSYGKTITPMWIVKTGERLISLIWQKYKLPVYLYMNQNPVVSAATDPAGKEALNLFLNSNGDGLSVFSKPAIGVDGYPADGTRPVLAYDGGKPWGFWLYNPVTVGIKTLYNKDKTGLYADLNYTSSGTSVPVTPPTGGSTVTPPTGGTVTADLSEVNAKLDAIYTYLTTHIK